MVNHKKNGGSRVKLAPTEDAQETNGFLCYKLRSRVKLAPTKKEGVLKLTLFLTISAWLLFYRIKYWRTHHIIKCYNVPDSGCFTIGKRKKGQRPKNMFFVRIKTWYIQDESMTQPYSI